MFHIKVVHLIRVSFTPHPGNFAYNLNNTFVKSELNKKKINLKIYLKQNLTTVFYQLSTVEIAQPTGKRVIMNASP